MTITQLMLLGVLAGADNFVVSSILGGLALSRQQRYGLAAAFGLCEAAMPWLGVALLGPAGWSGTVGPAALEPWCLLACGVLSLLGAACAASLLSTAAASQVATSGSSAVVSGRRLGLDVRLGWLSLLLPPALSFDNFAAGAGGHQPGTGAITAAITIGLVSAFLSGVGLIFGERVVLRWRVPRGLWVGSGLVACGLIALVIEG